MVDEIAGFPLRDATTEELGYSLGQAFAEYSKWHGHAMFLSRFVHDSRNAGVSRVIEGRIREGMALAEEFGIVTWTQERSETKEELHAEMAEHQLKLADVGVKIAAAVILHNACEKLLHRLVRFGLVANRNKAIEWIAERKVKIQSIVKGDADSLVDEQLEKWWDNLERDSLLLKWDKLAGLVEYPTKLDDGAWHFDIDMLAKFDDIRHNAVHHDGEKVKEFKLEEFGEQLQRAQLAWLLHVAQKLKTTIPAEVFFGLDSPPA